MKTKKKTSKKIKSKKAKKATRQIDRLEASVIYLTGLKGKRVAIDEAVKGANEVYRKAGGADNLKEAKFSLTRAVKVMALLGLLEIKDNTISRMK